MEIRGAVGGGAWLTLRKNLEKPDRPLRVNRTYLIDRTALACFGEICTSLW